MADPPAPAPAPKMCGNCEDPQQVAGHLGRHTPPAPKCVCLPEWAFGATGNDAEKVCPIHGPKPAPAPAPCRHPSSTGKVVRGMVCDDCHAVLSWRPPEPKDADPPAPAPAKDPGVVYCRKCGVKMLRYGSGEYGVMCDCVGEAGTTETPLAPAPAPAGKKYRKKPVVITAYQTTEKLVIPTLEGDHTALPGDYIITGVKGEKYPCKPDIFALTYEPVDDAPAPAPVCPACDLPVLAGEPHTDEKDCINYLRREVATLRDENVALCCVEDQNIALKAENERLKAALAGVEMADRLCAALKEGK